MICNGCSFRITGILRQPNIFRVSLSSYQW